MIKVGFQVMIVLLPLLCGRCATDGGILYGSTIALDAGSGVGNESNAEVGGGINIDAARVHHPSRTSTKSGSSSSTLGSERTHAQ